MKHKVEDVVSYMKLKRRMLSPMKQKQRMLSPIKHKVEKEDVESYET